MADSTATPHLATLPIDRVLPQLLEQLGRAGSVVLHAPTGAGKTTRVPPAVVHSGLIEGQLVMLEPRRVAARAAARRIASEQGWRLGGEVGYQVRFDRRAGPDTRLLVVTEGVLVAWLQRDPFLEEVGGLIFDEFHERSLDSDLSLAMARRVQNQARPDLRLLVMSATLESAPLAAFLGDCPVVRSRGRLFAVEKRYLSRPDSRPIPAAAAAGVRRALAEGPGDVLCFLPGVGEIRRTQELLGQLPGISIMQLYGNLPPEQQDAVLRPTTGRKVVLSTNVAETSVTLVGVGTVVDSGLVRRSVFDPASGLDRLELGRISLASAEQRAGRAGRLGPGLCLRLWTEHDHRSLAAHDRPEIRRVDLSQTVLQLHAWGESDALAFTWLDAPEPATIARATTLLEGLGAIANHGLTELGRQMARLPLNPRLARLLLAARSRRVPPRRAALLAALLAERDVVLRAATASMTTSSDALDRLRAVEAVARHGDGETALGEVHRGRAHQVLRAGRQIAAFISRRFESRSESRPGPSLAEQPANSDQALAQALLEAYPDRLAKRRQPRDPRGVLVGGRGVRLSKASSVHEADLFLCLQLDGGQARPGRAAEARVDMASAVEPEWLAGQRLHNHDEVFFDTTKERVAGRLRVSYEDLTIHTRQRTVSASEAAEVLLEAASQQLPRALALDRPAIDDFLRRLHWLAAEMPELGLPIFDDERLCQALPMLVAGRRSFAELRRSPVLEALRGSLSYEQAQALEQQAPERLTVPSGSRITLRYCTAEPPLLAVRIQELFGLAETPSLAGGRVPVLLHLLAPNGRPQQITRDLASFWSNTYPQVRKELQGRYPKHSWPTDPLRAKPQRRPQRRGQH